jgi:catechol 2,3-dioxygenase-like lactoylglutathione lyase family enzyme
MLKVNGIFETSLYVTDPERSQNFYVNVFGFETVATGERLIALGVGRNQLLLLCKKKASLELAQAAHDGEGQLHVAFSVSAEELPAWKEVLAKNNVTIESERAWQYGGKSIYFRDPDGHLIELATPGVWHKY